MMSYWVVITLTQEPTVSEVETEKKSIVPSKYAGKYKKGEGDELKLFIEGQCSDEGKFSFDKFFELCRKNGVADDKVAHYEALVASKVPGSQGRARMTLRNMLAPVVRKAGSLVGLDGASAAITLPPLPERQQKADA